MKKPTQCILWTHPEQVRKSLKDIFEVIETYFHDDDFWRYLLKCRECGQLYFYQFREERDWAGGNDPQYTTLIPVESNEEIETLKRISSLKQSQFSPRLQKDFPKDADEPKVYWVGKE